MPAPMFIVRGAPGAGKSTMAERIRGCGSCFIFETDNFFVDSINRHDYHFDSDFLGIAHSWNQGEVIRACRDCPDVPVIVANTFRQKFELKPYFDIAQVSNDDPILKKGRAKAQIMMFAALSEENIGQKVQPGTVIALIGDLGTGKTTLTKSIARGLGVTETVTSPTFNIIREYRSGRLPLYHFDVYRIGDPDEMFELGYEEYFYGDGVCVVEWADIIEELLPEDAVVITIDRGVSDEEREYEIEGITEDICIF